MITPSAIGSAIPSAQATAGGVVVAHVYPGSFADKAGIKVGERILSFNRKPVNDVIDVWFYSAAERLKIDWATQDGAVQSATIRKAFHEKLGVEVEPFEIKRCSNACVFCFVHQLPPGMRRELYVKDEDYRLSFLYGNYITGTNLSQADRARIIEQKLSPLYFSVHATDQQVREQLLVKRNIEPVVPLMKYFTDRGIYLNAQIVLCPGLNDGKVLEQTVFDLASLHPKLESIAIVPLGMTDHRARLPKLKDVTPEYAAAFLEDVAKLQRKVQKKIGFPLVFPSDEFYLIAAMQPPRYAEYPEIPQLANGVGMFYKFYEHFDDLCAGFPKSLPRPKRVAAITTLMGPKVLTKLVNAMNEQIDGLTLDLIPIENTLFGKGITVSGLLPGRDFKTAIAEHPGYDRYLIPENALRTWDQRFLDDMLFTELKQSTKAEVLTGADTADSFVSAVLSGLTS